MTQWTNTLGQRLIDDDGKRVVCSNCPCNPCGDLQLPDQITISGMTFCPSDTVAAVPIENRVNIAGTFSSINWVFWYEFQGRCEYYALVPANIGTVDDFGSNPNYGPYNGPVDLRFQLVIRSDGFMSFRSRLWIPYLDGDPIGTFWIQQARGQHIDVTAFPLINPVPQPSGAATITLANTITACDTGPSTTNTPSAGGSVEFVFS